MKNKKWSKSLQKNNQLPNFKHKKTDWKKFNYFNQK